MAEDIRRIQRFENNQKALKQLQNAVKLSTQKELSLLEKQGLIQSFEFTHELAWNLMKDYLNYQGNFDIKGSRDSIKESFKINIIGDGKLWMETIQARNLSAHTYNENLINEIYEAIKNEYIIIFEKLFNKFEKFIEDYNND